MSSLHWTPIALLPLFAGVLLGLVGFSAWPYRRSPLGRTFFLFLTAATVWSFGYAFELCATTLSTGLFWANVEYLGVPTSGPAIFAFCLTLSGARLSRKMWTALAIPGPFITLVAWTDGWHHLLRQRPALVPMDDYFVVTFARGPLYLANLVYAYGCLAATLVIVFRMAYGRNLLGRRQGQAILAGLALPILGNVAMQLGFQPLPGVDQTPVMFSLSAVAAAYGAFKWSLFSVAPIARDQVVDGLPDPVVALDPNGRVVDANPAAVRFFGIGARGIAGVTVEDLARAFPNGRLPEASGAVLDVGDRSYILRRSRLAGAEAGTILQLTDVTERRRAELAAEEASATKSRFVANVTHELRTPLNGVMGLADLLAGTELNERQREYLLGIQQCSQTLLGLISDVLDLSKLDAEAMPIAQDPVDLRELLEEIVRVHRPLAGQKGVDVRCEIEGLPPYVAGDGLRLRQVLHNLIGNALKFTEHGEAVIRATRQDDRYAIEVRDTGIGIPPEKLGTVFEAFQQADASTTRRYGGTGLGLPISRRLVERMGGTLTLESVYGQGTTMRIDLPLVEAMPPKAEVTAEFAMPDSMSVLVAEDNGVNAIVVTSMLEEIGCRVELAEDGEAAVAAFAQQPFDLVLMDVQMPKMDGYAATREIRRRFPDRRTPVIALTANALSEERERAEAAGMDGFLTKPVRRADLERALAALQPSTTV